MGRTTGSRRHLSIVAAALITGALAISSCSTIDQASRGPAQLTKAQKTSANKCKPTTKVGSPLQACDVLKFKASGPNMEDFTATGTKVVGHWQVSNEELIAVIIDGAKPYMPLEDLRGIYAYMDALRALSPKTGFVTRFQDPKWEKGRLKIRPVPNATKLHYIIINDDKSRQTHWRHVPWMSRLLFRPTSAAFTRTPPDKKYPATVTVLAGKSKWADDSINNLATKNNPQMPFLVAIEHMMATEACQSLIRAKGESTNTRDSYKPSDATTAAQETFCNSGAGAYTAFRMGWKAAVYAKRTKPRGYAGLTGNPDAVVFSASAFRSAAARAGLQPIG